jgi:hypothetical protein
MVTAPGAGAGRKLAADGSTPRGERDFADAGVALGAWLEAAAVPAGLIPHVDHLEHGRAFQVDPPAAQPGQLAKAESASATRTTTVNRSWTASGQDAWLG